MEGMENFQMPSVLANVTARGIPFAAAIGRIQFTKQVSVNHSGREVCFLFIHQCIVPKINYQSGIICVIVKPKTILFL